MAYRRRQQPPPTNSGITEDEKVVLVVEEEGKQIDANDYTAAAAAIRSRATRNITTTTTAAAANSSSSFYSSSSSSSSTAATSLVAKAIRASSAAHSHRDSSLSSAYAHSHPVSRHTSSSASISDRTAPSPSQAWDWGSHSSKPSDGEQASIRRNLNEAKQQQQPQGFWGNLARKAKSLLDVDEDNPLPSPPQHQQQQQQHQHEHGPRMASKPRYQNSNPNYESHQRKENPTLQKSLNAISSSISYIGNAVEEGLTVVEHRTAGIIQETRKHIKSKSIESTANSQGNNHRSMRQSSLRQMQMPPQMETDIQLQLKASRDVAMAMAAKAKLLLRELKTVKADLAFAKDRCAQLEEENKILRENRERGDNPEDDDLIRLQLETLLAEKARLAHENSVYARENRFLREVVEYHQLTMQDVVYIDEGTEEVTEVYPIKVVSHSHTVNTPSPPLPTESSVDSGLRVTQENSPRPVPPPGLL